MTRPETDTISPDDGPGATLDDNEIEKLVSIRRHLHAHPELSLQEYETAAFIRRQLDELGIPHETVADTGVVAIVEGEHPGPTLAWRADTDALPIQEVNDVDYRSENPGVMHACGHDVHTTMAIGIARQLVRRRDELHGRMKFIFQPAEEASPVDEPIGAERMAREGVLENPGVDAVFAVHCMPSLDVGKIGFTGGPVWASSDLVQIELRGKKTHAAYPHEGIDAVLVAGHVITALQAVTSRIIDTRQACVLSIGHLEAGNTYNVIADRAKLTGILRTLSEETTRRAKEETRRIVSGVCAAFGASGEVHFTEGARLTANDLQLERRVVSLLRTRIGEARVVAHQPQLGAEDFAAFSRRVPGCYLFLGVRNEERGITSGIHTPDFDVDEGCLPFGVAAITDALLELGRTW